jgi:hypothetical protein
MQVNYHVGLVLGIAGTILLGNAFYCKNWMKPPHFSRRNHISHISHISHQ